MICSFRPESINYFFIFPPANITVLSLIHTVGPYHPFKNDLNLISANCTTMTNSHHLDPGKPLEMMDVVTLLMKNCGQNVNAERAHTNEKFHLECVHVNEKIRS